MKPSLAVTLVNSNPAPDHIRRIVNITRKPNAEENQLLDRAFAAKPVKAQAMKREIFEENFWHKEQDLVKMIEDDLKVAGNFGVTAYALLSSDISHSGVAAAVLACDRLEAPVIIYQHKDGRLNSLEVLYNNQRYVVSAKESATMAGGA